MKNDILNDNISSRVFNILKTRIEIGYVFSILVAVLFLLYSPLTEKILSILEFYIPYAVIQKAAFSVYLAGVIYLCLFPLSYYKNIIFDKDFDISNIEPLSWIMNYLKQFFIAAGLTSIFILYFLFAVMVLGSFWWLPTSLLAGVFYYALMQIATKRFNLLFTDIIPYEEESVVESLALISDPLIIEGVYSYDSSSDNRIVNALLTGTNKSKKILLSDALIDGFSQKEIELFYTHELLQHKEKHTLKITLISVFIIVLFSSLSGLLYNMTLSAKGFTDLASVAALPYFLFYVFFFSCLFVVITNYLSRKLEEEADKELLAALPNRKFFKKTLEKIGKYNLSEYYPDKVHELIFSPNNSLLRRIALIDQIK